MNSAHTGSGGTHNDGYSSSMQSLMIIIPIWVRIIYWTAIACGSAAVVACFSVVRSVNKLRRPGDREGYVGWDLRKINRVFNEYEARFPNGKAVVSFKLLVIAAGWLFGGWVFLSLWYGRA